MGIYYSFAIVGVVAFVRFLKTTTGHYAFDRLTLKLPLFGKLSRGINAARFASTFIYFDSFRRAIGRCLKDWCCCDQ